MKPHGVTYFVQDTTRNGFASFVERLRVEELEMDVQPWTQEDMRSLSTDKIQYTPEVDDSYAFFTIRHSRHQTVDVREKGT